MVEFFNVRFSLWARSVLVWWARIGVSLVLGTVLLLNTVGVALFVFNNSATSNGQSSSKYPPLVELSAIILTLFGLGMIASVLFARVVGDHSRVDRIRAKTIVLSLGVSLLMFGEIVRLIASFFIWRPQGEQDAASSSSSSVAILSKPVFYATGWGIDILILFLYAVTRIDIIFSPPLSFAMVSPLDGSTRRPFGSGGGGSVPLNQSFAWPTAMRAASSSGNRRQGSPSPVHSASRNSDTFSLEKSVTPERQQSPPSSGSGGVVVQNGPQQPQQPRQMFIAVHRTFSVSSNRVSA